MAAVRLAGLAKLYDTATTTQEDDFYANAIIQALNANGHRKELAIGTENLLRMADAAFAAQGRQYNQKIPLIKFVRTLTQWGFKETKDWVEANIPEFHPGRKPEHFSRNGC